MIIMITMIIMTNSSSPPHSVCNAARFFILTARCNMSNLMMARMMMVINHDSVGDLGRMKVMMTIMIDEDHFQNKGKS